MRYRSFSTASFLFVICILASSLAAQTGRSKSKPLATPPPTVLTGAEIISQGEENAEPVATPVEKPLAKPATTNTERIKQLNDRVKKLEEGQNNTYDENQKRMLMNLDILTRAEQREDSLRKQVFDMIEKENNIKARLDQIEFDIRPENIERTLLINGGSTRPEEIRESRKKSLGAERANLQSLLIQVQTTRVNLEANLLKAEQMVEKLRAKAEKDIDQSLQNSEEPTKNDQ